MTWIFCITCSEKRSDSDRIGPQSTKPNLTEKLNSLSRRSISGESGKCGVESGDSWLGHFVEQFEGVWERDRVGGVCGGEGGGGVRVRVETGFEEMGMEDLRLGRGRGREIGACFEENGECEGVRSVGGRVVEVGIEVKSFFV